jgi:hypothetical protein
MKYEKTKLVALAAAAIYGLAACGGEKNHDDHDDHDHGDDHKHDESAETGDDENHDHDHDHAHDEIVAGPNGGRVLTEVEPHAEFLVTDDRKVQITFVDDDLKPVPAAEQSVRVVAGDRSNPTKLEFTKSGDVLVSDKVLPEGNDFPVVVQITTSPDAKRVPVKFNLNMEQCPTCENKEYACTCEH